MQYRPERNKRRVRQCFWYHDFGLRQTERQGVMGDNRERVDLVVYTLITDPDTSRIPLASIMWAGLGVSLVASPD